MSKVSCFCIHFFMGFGVLTSGIALAEGYFPELNKDAAFQKSPPDLEFRSQVEDALDRYKSNFDVAKDGTPYRVSMYYSKKYFEWHRFYMIPEVLFRYYERDDSRPFQEHLHVFMDSYADTFRPFLKEKAVFLPKSTPLEDKKEYSVWIRKKGIPKDSPEYDPLALQGPYFTFTVISIPEATYRENPRFFTPTGKPKGDLVVKIRRYLREFVLVKNGDLEKDRDFQSIRAKHSRTVTELLRLQDSIRPERPIDLIHWSQVVQEKVAEGKKEELQALIGAQPDQEILVLNILLDLLTEFHYRHLDGAILVDAEVGLPEFLDAREMIAALRTQLEVSATHESRSRAYIRQFEKDEKILDFVMPPSLRVSRERFLKIVRMGDLRRTQRILVEREDEIKKSKLVLTYENVVPFILDKNEELNEDIVAAVLQDLKLITDEDLSQYLSTVLR